MKLILKLFLYMIAFICFPFELVIWLICLLFGLNYENNRLNENNDNAKDYFDKLNIDSYIRNKIKLIENKINLINDNNVKFK